MPPKEIINEDFEFPSEVEAQGTQTETEIENNPLEYEIVDDTPPEDRNKKPLPEAVAKEAAEPQEDELDNYSDSVKKRFNQLTHRYHDERRAKEAMQREHEQAIKLAQTIYEENQRLQQTLTWGQQEYIKAEMAKHEYAQKLAEDKYRKAYEAGDTEGVLSAQRDMQEAAIQKERVASGNIPMPPPEVQNVAQSNLANNYLQQPQVPVYNQPQAEPERPAAPPRDPKAEEWASRNPWFGADKEMTSLAYGLHSKLVDSGVDPQSDEYYSTIDKRMKEVFPEYFGVKPSKPRASSPVAPAGRSTASRKVTLTATQVALAKKIGVPLDVYAKHVAKLEQANG